MIYLYNLKSRKGEDYKCSILNDRGRKVADKLIRRDHENLFNYNECNVFAVNNEEVYISPVYDNRIYHGENLDPVYWVRFVGKEFPNEQNVEEQDVNSSDFNYVVKNNYYVSNRYFIFDYLIQDQRVFCVVDKSNDKVEVGVVKNDLIQGYRFFPRWGDEKYLSLIHI